MRAYTFIYELIKYMYIKLWRYLQMILQVRCRWRFDELRTNHGSHIKFIALSVLIHT